MRWAISLRFTLLSPSLLDSLQSESNHRLNSNLRLVFWFRVNLSQGSSLSLTKELISTKIVSVQPDEGDILGNFRRGAEAVLDHDASAKAIALVSSDIPLITSESVDWVVKSAWPADLDIYYPIIEQSLMEERFPESARSYVKLKGMNVCGGDLAVINLDLHKTREDFWRRIIEARKSYLNQAALVGFDVLFLLLLRQINLPNLVEKVTARLKITGKALICPYPELGMDVDKPHQVDVARKELI